MSLFYSQLTGGFYDAAIHTREQIPSDAVSITEEMHQELFNNQAIGKLITAGNDGVPVNSDRPGLTSEQLASAIRSQRDAFIANTDYLVMPDYPITADKLGLVKTYRQLLRDITKQTRFPTDIDWPPKPI